MEGIQYGHLYTPLYDDDLKTIGTPREIATLIIRNTEDTNDFTIDSCQLVTNRDFPGRQFIDAEYTYCKHNEE